MNSAAIANVEIKAEQFKSLLNQSVIFNLFKEITIHNYVECSQGYEREMEALLNTTFGILDRSKVDEKSLEESVNYLVKEVFKKKDPDFWFNRVYKNYKRNIKPAKRYNIIKELIQGNRILDVGCGDGLLSYELLKNNFDVSMTDVLDYRDGQTKEISFRLMGSSVNMLQFPDKFFDTTILFSVLHHIDGQYLIDMINELKRVSTRIIIEENCFGLSLSDEIQNFEQILEDDNQLASFLSLSENDQLRYLMLSDYFSNSIGQGITAMNFPFEFKTIREWKRIFELNGLALRSTKLLGFQKGNFTRSCDVMFELDVIN